MMGLIHRTTMDGYGNKNCVAQLGSCEQNGKKAPRSLIQHGESFSASFRTVRPSTRRKYGHHLLPKLVPNIVIFAVGPYAYGTWYQIV